MKPAIIIVAALIMCQAVANLIADWNETPVPEGVVEDDVIQELRGSYTETVADRHD